MRKGSEAIGNFVKQVRHACGYPEGKLNLFAANELALDGSYLGRVESGDRLPGPEFLAALMPFIRKANMNPRHLLYMWLEAQGLSAYVEAVKQRKGKQ